MKKLALFALALCLTLPAAAPPELGAPAVAAYHDLHTASPFKLGRVGLTGATSSGETALRELQHDSNSTAAFLALLDDETTAKAGQLYALFGLEEARDSQFEARLPIFLNDDSLVNTQIGCIRIPVKVKGIAADFADKK